MKAQEILDKLEEQGFEGIDASIKISLLEYGLLYNEELELLIQTLPNLLDVEDIDIDDLDFDISTVTKQEVIESLENIAEYYFEFIGSTLEQEIKRLHIAGSIHSINQWNGEYVEHSSNYSLAGVIDFLKDHSALTTPKGQ